MGAHQAGGAAAAAAASHARQTRAETKRAAAAAAAASAMASGMPAEELRNSGGAKTTQTAAALRYFAGGGMTAHMHSRPSAGELFSSSAASGGGGGGGAADAQGALGGPSAVVGGLAAAFAGAGRPSAQNNMSIRWAEAHAVLDQLEREALLDLQMELAALLSERMHLLGDRTDESLKAWQERLRIAGSTFGGLSGVVIGGGGEGGGSGVDHETTDEALVLNKRSLVRTRTAFLAGLPSDERSEAAGLVWENAMLRAEVHAGRQALHTVHRQAAELAERVQADRWGHGTTAPLIVELSDRAGALAAEQGAAIDRLSAWNGQMSADDDDDEVGGGGGGSGAASGSGSAGGVTGAVGGMAGRFRFLAQLVPAMLRHSRGSFAAVLRESRDLSGRHRAEREALCAQLRLAPKAEEQGPRPWPTTPRSQSRPEAVGSRQAQETRMDEQPPPPPPSELTPAQAADGLPPTAAKRQHGDDDPSSPFEGEQGSSRGEQGLHSMRPLKREGSLEKLRRSLTGSLGMVSPHGLLRRMVSVSAGKTPPPSPQKDARL
jgi:hypothetical protein